MIRAWDDAAGWVDDRIGVPLAALALLAFALLVGVAWATFPRWLPWRWWARFWRVARRVLGRLGRGILLLPGRIARLRWRSLKLGTFRWRWRRRGAATATASVVATTADDGLPDLPEHDFRTLADWYAAQGRWAEAVRERLRGIVRALVTAGVIVAPPGSTVVELAAAAGGALPPVHAPVSAASQVFSDIWYGQRPAVPADDALLRGYADAVGAVLTGATVSDASAPVGVR